MNSPSSSDEDLRTCAFLSLIGPIRSWRQGLRKLHPTRLLLRANQLTCEGDFRLSRPFSGAFCLAFPPSEIPAFLTPVTRNGSLQIGSLAPISGKGENPSDIKVPGQT
jgi:hypothetical protein